MYELDLTDNDDFNHLLETLKYLSINCLINNVGIGGTMHFTKTPAEFLHRIINLNIRITSMLTYHLLSHLQAHRKSHIINISSIISQYPAAFKTIYPASKSFIYSFSLGLREELRNSPVCVSVALPGPMDTNPDVHKRLMEKQGKIAKASTLTPARVAGKIMEQALQNKGLIIPGALNKLCWYLMKIIPLELGVPYLSKIISREILPVRNANASQKYKPVEQEH
jgi:short-subunit dehydrogenase